MAAFDLATEGRDKNGDLPMRESAIQFLKCDLSIGLVLLPNGFPNLIVVARAYRSFRNKSGFEPLDRRSELCVMWMGGGQLLE